MDTMTESEAYAFLAEKRPGRGRPPKEWSDRKALALRIVASGKTTVLTAHPGVRLDGDVDSGEWPESYDSPLFAAKPLIAIIKESDPVVTAALAVLPGPFSDIAW